MLGTAWSKLGTADSPQLKSSELTFKTDEAIEHFNETYSGWVPAVIMKVDVGSSAGWDTFGHAWNRLGNAWNTLGHAWNTLGHAWDTLGHAWNRLGHAWNMLGTLGTS